MLLPDRVAVVTGASAGLGKAFALALNGAGMRVAGLARSKDRLDTLRDALGDRFLPVVCDVTDAKAIDKAFTAIDAAFGRVDVLVNNAGFGLFGAVEDLALDALDAEFDTNVRGLVVCTQHAVRRMKAQGKDADGMAGYVVNIASIAGLLGTERLSAYNATKFAVRGLSEAWMKELRPAGIKVTCFYPGSVETEFSGRAGGRHAPGKSSGEPMQPEDLAETLLHVLQSPARTLISEVVMRPMRPA